MNKKTWYLIAAILLVALVVVLVVLQPWKSGERRRRRGKDGCPVAADGSCGRRERGGRFRRGSGD